MFGVKNRGRIELIIGPMMCGKTGELSRRVRYELIAGHNVVVIKHSSDDRLGSNSVLLSHSGDRLIAGGTLLVNTCERLRDCNVLGADVVAVDEGQFFPDLVETSVKWAGDGIRVIVSALDGDSDSKPFGSVCDLVPQCESVDKLSGVCMACLQAPSVFSVRVDGSAARCDVGGSDKYRSVCRSCRAIAPPK